jgi:hypothetical protein
MMADIFCIPFSVLAVSQTSEHKAISLVVSAYILIVTLIEMQDISLFILVHRVQSCNIIVVCGTLVQCELLYLVFLSDIVRD